MAALPRACVELLIEVGCRDVKLVGVDANYGSVFFVHSNNFEGVLPAEYYIVVELIPGTG